MAPTDIVITTRVTTDRPDRLGYLQQCLKFIWERTRSPYLLHVVDDSSDVKTDAREWLWEMYKRQKINTLVFCDRKGGQRARLNAGFWLTFSDPMVFTDDDVLVPDVEPDWIARALEAFQQHPEFGVIALNSPAFNLIRAGGARGKIGTIGQITECKSLPGHMVFMRRKLMEGWHWPHVQGQRMIAPGQHFPDSQRCERARQCGLKIGYLTTTYCYHAGNVAVREEKAVEPNIVEPVDWQTLRPPKEYAW